MATGEYNAGVVLQSTSIVSGAGGGAEGNWFHSHDLCMIIKMH